MRALRPAPSELCEDCCGVLPLYYAPKFLVRGHARATNGVYPVG